MTSQEQSKVIEAIKNDYPSLQEDLIEQLRVYVETNNAKGSNRVSFVNLPFELRKSITKVKAKSSGKLFK